MDNAQNQTDLVPPPCRESLACAAALKQGRHRIATALLENLALMPRWREEVERNRHDLDAFVRRELYVFIDYLHHYLRTGDEAYRHLYIGEKLKQTYDAGCSPERAAELRASVASLDREVFLSTLAPIVAPSALDYLDSHLNYVHNLLMSAGFKTVNTLFIQDCLYLDIMAFLAAPLVQYGIGLNSFYATSKNGEELRANLRELSKNKMDVVFFSPFTYEFNPEFAQVLQWRNSLKRSVNLSQECRRAMDETQVTLDLISDLFDCQVFVHNTINLIREPSSAKRLVKNLLTRRARHRSSQHVNQWLAQYVAEKNQSTFEHLFIIDERRVLETHGELELGAQYYSSELQHPVVFGRHIARLYAQIIFVQAYLLKKKLVVCDLDNTLWEGLIGEGEVRHYQDRQQILKRLREKGVVLAVNSKNDPVKVHWGGCALTEEDFVCREISWDPKVVGMNRIQAALNLKLKDYVFIDDRRDEREMMKTQFPDILTMDATDPWTWQLLDWWACLLESRPEVDRTLLYRQREERQRFLQSGEAAERCDPAELFKGLGLRVHLRKAKHDDLKRVAELINRTNQFNLCATRTSFGEVSAWSQSEDRRIVIAHAEDRFGEMGMVCVAVVTLAESAVEVPVFVLSCRVFGYGIENVMINHIKRMAGERSITGWYKPTAQNGPCKDLYAVNGFRQSEDAWVHTGPGEVADPEWLEVSEE